MKIEFTIHFTGISESIFESQKRKKRWADILEPANPMISTP